MLAFGDDTMVTMTRQPAPGKIFQLPSRESPETQRKSLALAMRRFAQSPVVLEAPFHACVYGNGQEDFFHVFLRCVVFHLCFWSGEALSVRNLFELSSECIH